jgi:hypothetical protein
MTDTPLARNNGHWLPSCARRRRTTTSCAAPLTAAQTPKTAMTAATLLLAATPRAAATTVLVRALTSSSRKSGSILGPRVDQRGDRVDQRIEDEQDSGDDRHAGRQRVRHRREDNGSWDGDDATNEEHALGPCFLEPMKCSCRPPEGALNATTVARWAVRRARVRPWWVPGFARAAFCSTHATILLRDGVLVYIVAKRLGHKDPSVTLKVYTEVIPDDETSAADVFSEAHQRRCLEAVSRGGVCQVPVPA